MLIKDADKKLDMMCGIAKAYDPQWLSAAKKMEKPTSAYLLSNSGGSILQFCFKKVDLPVLEVPIASSDTTFEERPSFYMVSSKVDASEDFSHISELMEVPSVVASRFQLYGGELTMQFRFHHSVSEKVNEVLETLINRGSSTRISYVGPSPGIMQILQGIHDEGALNVIRYTFRQEVYSEYFPFLEAKDPGALAEIEYRYRTEQGSRVIVYSDTSSGRNLSTISQDDMVFESSYAGGLVLANIGRSEGSTAPGVASFVRSLGGSIECTDFVPADWSDEYISAFFSGTSKLNENKPVLELYCPLSHEIWNWL